METSPSESAPERRRNDPQALRGRVLDAAAALFQSNGYGATTTQQIAAAAGVTHGAMHHHFPTKKALGLAVVRERVRDAIHETWVAPMRDEATARDAVSAIFETIGASLDRSGRVEGCPLNNLTLELALGDADFRSEVSPIFDDWRGAVAARVREDQQAGLSRGLDPEAFATQVVAACSGAMAMAKADQSSAALRIVARQFSDARAAGDRA